MRRDDFGMRVDEIRALATKYSKQELGRMVQMGMIEPQKALMAGMMIDRIEKQNMQPPQTTVAQDVLAAQQMPPQGQPPQGLMAAPNAPPPSAGVAALPSGMQNMAGGGIVAFAEGGDTDIPSYAGDRGSVVDAGVIDKIDPNWRSVKNRKVYSPDDKFAILAEELRNLQTDLGSATGENKRRIEGNIAQLQQEMRRVKPAPSAGLTSLIPIPSAEAAPVTPMAAPAPAAQPTAPEEEAVYDPMTGLKITGPEPTPYDPRIKPGTKYEPNIIRDILQGGPGAKPAAPPPAKPVAPAPAAPSKFDVQPAPPRAEQVPTPEPAAPAIERPEKIQAEQIAVPAERTFGQEYGDITDAYRQAGVDVDMYKNMMQELKDKKAGLAQKKEQALGAALMAFGLGLSGARKGQVMQSLGNEGQKALGLYMNNMDKISENEDKIDILNRQIAMAENNFKRTGAESALSQVRQRRERIDQIEAKNAELRERANEHQATVAANVYHTDVWAKVSGENAAQQVAARLAAAQAQAGRAGALTQKQRFDIEQQLRTELEPKLREQYKNHPNPDKKVAEELSKEIRKRIGQLQSQPSGYGGSPPPQDMFADWTVEGM